MFIATPSLYAIIIGWPDILQYFSRELDSRAGHVISA